VGRMETRSREPMHPTRMNTRIDGQPNAMNRVEDGVRHQNQSGSIPGTNLNSLNSFAILDDVLELWKWVLILILLIWKRLII
jgi:hypothetical protein